MIKDSKKIFEPLSDDKLEEVFGTKFECRYSLSVIIPIHRSVLNVERCINSLLLNDKLNLQIIVAANNDSRDELGKIRQKIKDRYSNTFCVTCLAIHKSGKANAINRALKYVENEIVLIGDADTYFCREGLNRCLSIINKDHSVIAITGIVDVYEKNLLSGIQQFEYSRIFRIFRPLLNLINGNLMISGCAGIFRTKCLFEVGMYDTHTIGEDFEITLRLHDYYIRNKKSYKIKYVNIVLAKTDAPLDFNSLIEQRRRWFLGFLQVTARYRKIIFHPITYWRIYIPFVLSIIAEKWSCFLKWVLIAISIGICVHYDGFPLRGVLLCFFYFGLFEVFFNGITMKKQTISEERNPWIITVALMTVCLMAMQFVIKDTNLFHILRKKNRLKENKWR